MSLIILIDDDTDMLTMTGRWLEKAGYEVKKAASGADGLDLIRTFHPDLILLDHRMPEMDGPAVLRAIREDEATRSIPVLYRTGSEDSELDEDSEVKADGYVPKSGGKPALMQAVAGII